MPIFSLLLLSLLSFISSSSHSLLPLTSANSITLPLSRVAQPSTNNNKTNPPDILKHHAAASLQRAKHLKCPNVDNYHAQLYSRYGFYSVPLSFGTPQQPIRFLMDTASSVSWFPCTQAYNCTDCYHTGVDPSNIPTFIPESSSSYKPLACASPRCKLFLRYPQCNKTRKYCGYKLSYGVGKRTGWLVSETLTFPSPGGEGLSVHNFIVGCSVSSDHLPLGTGILGLGRAQVSLPTQMGLKSFSYCMLSIDLNENATASSDLVLTTTTTKERGNNVQYTPFAKSPNVSSYPEMLEHYYVMLQNISVGGVNVRVPYEYLVADANGHGGTMVDSGTTFTHMEKPVFDLVFNEFQNQVCNTYNRSPKFEKETGLPLCYNVDTDEIKKLPQLTFRFVGGAEMVLPLLNYFSYADDANSVLCMTIVNGVGDDGKVGLGPSIILGNIQQQNYYMEFDLENNRLGIRQQIC